MERQILHIDVNSFAVSVERVVNSRLRLRPVVVAYPEMERSVVQSVSAEARQSGIYRGMQLGQALKQCRDVIVVPPNEPLYSRAMRAMLNIMSRYTPLVEPNNYGHAYLDMTGTGRLLGITVDTASKIQREILHQISLPTSFGIASNKLVSRIASSIIKPEGGIQEVKYGLEQQFIAPLKVHYLPLLEKKVKTQLQELNISIIRQIAEISLHHLTMVFGRSGIKLHRAARGIDPTPVWTPQQLPNVYEEHILTEDTNDLNLLRGVLYRLIEQVGFRLRQSCQAARKIILEIYYADHREAIGQKKIPRASNQDRELFDTAEKLMMKIITRRIRVKKISVRSFQLVPAAAQLSLFDQPKRTTNPNLTLAMDKIRNKFGEDSLKFSLVN